MAHTITIDIFNPASIDKAIARVKAYRDEIVEKTDLFRKVIAEQIQWNAQEGFSTASTGTIVFGSQPINDVQVEVSHGESISIVFAQGEQAVFMEYGAGVFHNGEAGQSPHPWGAQFGYYIGGYGKGFGERRAWGYRDEAGNLTVTHGTPAAMPMFRGFEEAERLVEQTIKGVFG